MNKKTKTILLLLSLAIAIIIVRVSAELQNQFIWRYALNITALGLIVLSMAIAIYHDHSLKSSPRMHADSSPSPSMHADSLPSPEYVDVNQPTPSTTQYTFDSDRVTITPSSSEQNFYIPRRDRRKINFNASE